MERKNQNLEFSQKLCTKSDVCLERRSPHKLFGIARPVCASGGDIASSASHGSHGSHHSSVKNSSYRNTSHNKSNHSEDEEDDQDENDEQNTGESDTMPSDSQHRIRGLRNSNGQAANKQLLDMHMHSSKRNNIKKTESCSKYVESGTKLKAELAKYKKELKAYNTTTKDLEEKYMKINHELNEMQQKHNRFVASRNNTREIDIYSDSSSSSSSASEFSLKRKYTQVFHRGSSFMTMLPPQSHSSNDNVHEKAKYCNPHAAHDINMGRKKRKQPMTQITSRADFSSTVRHTCTPPVVVVPQKRHSKRKMDGNKENEPPGARDCPSAMITSSHNTRSQSDGLNDIYKVLKNVLDTNQSKTSNKNIDIKELQTTIANLESEQTQFRSIIRQQQGCLHDYHSRCVKAQHIMQTQQHEIEKLNSNNQQLETDISAGIDKLRMKIDSKLRDVAHLPQLMREEQTKFDKVAKENSMLTDRFRKLQGEAAELKVKLDELVRRKTMTINRLRAAERDLKIFKNYNTALKHEKRKLNDEMQKLKEQLEVVQNASKRTMSRQREQNEKQRRELQKRVFELELRISRSQNSTTNLIQERDSLIAELQTQLNTLVHNFEVSQKHIRVLRRHIYTMSGTNAPQYNARFLTHDA